MSDRIPRCPKCGAGPLGNCGYYGCETPRNTCPLSQKDATLSPAPVVDAVKQGDAQ